MRWVNALSVLLFISNYACAVGSSSFTVNGTITGSTCNVSVDSTKTVILPQQRRSELRSGSTAGKTPFKISVTGCSTSATLYFQNNQTTVNAEGRLINTVQPGSDGGAANVELEILNAAGGRVQLANSQGMQSIGSVRQGETSEAGIFDFFVQYYANGKVTSGKVRSSLTFLVESF